jgi:hypothetical protein
MVRVRAVQHVPPMSGAVHPERERLRSGPRTLTDVFCCCGVTLTGSAQPVEGAAALGGIVTEVAASLHVGTVRNGHRGGTIVPLQWCTVSLPPLIVQKLDEIAHSSRSGGRQGYGHARLPGARDTHARAASAQQ